MSVQDLIAQEDTAQSFMYRFFLWPQMWQNYLNDNGAVFNWHTCRFISNQSNTIPPSPGIYTFIIEPGIANHPLSSYLMYVGKTKSLRRRFRQYITEKNRELGRPRVVRLLNKYPENIFFCYTVVDNPDDLGGIEQSLQNAFIPPCNDQLPTEVSRIIEALR